MDGEEQVGLVGQVGDIGGLWVVGGDVQLGVGVFLGVFFGVVVVDCQWCVVFGCEQLGQFWCGGFWWDDLVGVGVVGGDDNQGFVIGFGEGQGFLYGFVEVDGFVDLVVWICGMVLFVDGCVFDLQEEVVWIVFQQFDGFVGYLCQGWDVGGVFWVCFVVYCWLVQVVVVGGGWIELVYWYVVWCEQVDQWLFLVGVVYGFQFVEVFDDLVVVGFGLGVEGFVGIVVSFGGFCEGCGVVVENYVRVGFQLLFGD